MMRYKRYEIMARPVGKRAAQSWRGPANKLIWTLADQVEACKLGFFVGVRKEQTNDQGYGAHKFERAHINLSFGGLSGKLTKPMFLDMFAKGVGARDQFWLKLFDFIEQQKQWGYVGAWEEKARTLMGVKNAEREDHFNRVNKIAEREQRAT